MKSKITFGIVDLLIILINAYCVLLIFIDILILILSCLSAANDPNYSLLQGILHSGSFILSIIFPIFTIIGSILIYRCIGELKRKFIELEEDIDETIEHLKREEK